jgi:phosphopantothenoylcysteine decarboxylase/phosphopantothenate--cysteine ligase
VVAIMTRSARKFVGEVTFEAITRRPVITDQYARGATPASSTSRWRPTSDSARGAGHGERHRQARNGIADDFLTSLYLATRAPGPPRAGDEHQHARAPAVQRNIETLTSRGVRFVDPGPASSPAAGSARAGSPSRGDCRGGEATVSAAGLLGAQSKGSLLGRRIVVSAGPTYEDIDPVRYLGNRSSGRMGYAMRAEASRRGAHVVLVSGPTKLEPPAGVQSSACAAPRRWRAR